MRRVGAVGLRPAKSNGVWRGTVWPIRCVSRFRLRKNKAYSEPRRFAATHLIRRTLDLCILTKDAETGNRSLSCRMLSEGVHALPGTAMESTLYIRRTYRTYRFLSSEPPL
jgi:hypothetical protein